MGRELRRKQAKKDGKSLEKEEIVEEQHIRRYVIIVMALVIILSVLYLLSSLFITKELDWFNKKEKEEETQKEESDDILASEIFKQAEEEYYVYFYDFSEVESVITETVGNKLSYYKVYRVNTNLVMNSKYVGEIGNKKAKKIEDLKVVPPTLIKISSGAITEYYEGNEIIKALS